jgi:hypothetical protein
MVIAPWSIAALSSPCLCLCMQARLQLDQDMAQLLQHMGGTWLGPWQCLLAASRPAALPPAAAQAAAVDFVSEHFDTFSGECKSSLLQLGASQSNLARA